MSSSRETIRVQPPSMSKLMDPKEYEEQKRTETTEASAAMFSVLKELGHGRPPRTTDISRAIDRINAILEQEEQVAGSAVAPPSAAATESVALDETGRRFLANTRNVLEQSKNILQQRSQDDQIQSFLYHTVVAPKQLSAAATSIDEETRKKLQEAQQSLRAIGFHGRKVILLLARSPEFRDSINTLISIAQRLLGKPEFRHELVEAAKETTATFGGGSAGESGVETSPPRAVESVTSTSYHYKSSERGKGVAPGASFLSPAHAGTFASNAPVDIPIEEEEEDEYEEYEEEEELEMEEAAQTTTATTATATSLSSKIGTTQQEIRYAPKRSGDSSSGALAGSESQSPTQSAAGATQKLSERVQQEVDEDTRKRLQSNAVVILRSLAANPDQKLALQSLFHLVSLASSYGVTAANATTDSTATGTDNAATSPSLTQVANEGKEVLSRFADMTVLNSLVHNLRVFITEVREDDESTRLFHKIRRYVEQALDEPQLLDQAWYRQKASRLLDKVIIWGQRYSQHAALEAALSDWRLLLDGISQDQQLNEFSVALKKWTEDVTYLDTKGKRHLNAQLVSQLRSVFLPIIIEQFHYIPVPVIEDSDDKYDWKFENIIFSGYDLLPEHIFIDTDSHTDLKPLSDSQHEIVDSTIEGQGVTAVPASSTRRHHKFGRLFHSKSASKEEGKEQGGKRVHWPPREKLAPGTTKLSSKTTNHPGPVLSPHGHWRTTGQLVVRAYNIQLAMKNVKFFVRRKTFPRTEQSGLVDVHTKGSKGCKVIIRLDLTSDNLLNTGLFSGGAAEVSIARLAIRIHDSKHNFLLNTLAKLISGSIRRRIQKTITENMSEGVKKVLEAVNNTVTNSPGFAQGIVSALTPSKISPLKQAGQLASEAISPAKSSVVGGASGGGEAVTQAS